MQHETFSDLKREAHKITNTGKPAKMVWTELRNWASARGPIAMKAAVMEFVHSYHGSSEMAILLPELMRSTTFSPYEEKALIQLADHKVNLLENKLSPTLAPKTMLPAHSSRPALSIHLDPKIRSSPLRSEFTSDPRDAIFTFKEQTKISFTTPKMVERKEIKFDQPAFQSYSMAMDSKRSHGEHIIHHLANHMRSHGVDDIPSAKVTPKIKAKPKHKPVKHPKVVKKSKKTKRR